MRVSGAALRDRYRGDGGAGRGNVAGECVSFARAGRGGKLRPCMGCGADASGRRAGRSPPRRSAESHTRHAFATGCRGLRAARNLSRCDDRYPPRSPCSCAFAAVAADGCLARGAARAGARRARKTFSRTPGWCSTSSCSAPRIQACKCPRNRYVRCRSKHCWTTAAEGPPVFTCERGDLPDRLS